ncbi:hypothetical protein [Paenibacillus ginsengihumi]|nr:hypothetical protein [Paenibacillus ginsengihumi]
MTKHLLAKDVFLENSTKSFGEFSTPQVTPMTIGIARQRRLS